MKLNKYFLLIGMAVAGVLSSCGDDEDFQSGPQTVGQGVSFGTASSAASETFLPTDEPALTIPVYRKVSEEAADIAVIVNLNDSVDGEAIFEIPTSVHFNAGEDMAELTVRFPDAELGVTYSFEIELPAEDKNPYATNLLRRNVMRDYEWIAYEGTISTEFDEINSNVTVEKAKGFPIWRVVDPFVGYWEENYGDDNPDYSIVAQYINFTVNEDGSVKFETYVNDAYDEENLIYAFWPLDLSPSLTAEAAMSKVVDEQTVELYPYYYIPGVGGWGTFAVTITLDEDGASFVEE